jgi:hypothetical protein
MGHSGRDFACPGHPDKAAAQFLLEMVNGEKGIVCFFAEVKTRREMRLAW